MSGTSRFAGSQAVRDARTGRVRKVRGEFELPVADTAGDPVEALLLGSAGDLGPTAAPGDLQVIQNAKTPTGRVVRNGQL